MKSQTVIKIKNTIVIISVLAAIFTTHFISEYKESSLGHKITVFMITNKWKLVAHFRANPSGI